LFPYGYGLSYGDDSALDTLSEASGVESDPRKFNGEIISRGAAAKAFSFWFEDSSNANTPVTSLVSSSLGGLIKSRGVDFKAQEDSREITWTGKASLSIRSPRPLDISNFSGNTLNLKWRIDDRPVGNMTLGIDCGGGCSGKIDLDEIASAAPIGEWIDTQIPLSCFVKAGLNLAAISAPLRIESDTAAKITLHNIEITESDTTQLLCPTNG